MREGCSTSSSSRLLAIISRERDHHHQADTGQQEAARPPAGVAWHRLGRRLSRSFSKLRSLGSKRWQGAKLAASDSGLARTTPSSRKPPEKEEEEDKHSFDSGLDTEGSEDHNSSFSERKASNTQNASTVSSQTIDSGLHQARISPSSCLVTRRPADQHGPKKRVSIRLPQDSRYTAVFGPALQLEPVHTYQQARPAAAAAAAAAAGSRQTVSLQTQAILTRAREELVKRTPHLCDTLQLLFRPDSILFLRLMNSDQIGRLMFEIRTILFTGLVSVPYFETSLFMVQNFLLNMSSIVQTIPGLEQFPDCCRNLMATCQRFNYSDHSFCLKETQSLYIDLWCSLISSL